MRQFLKRLYAVEAWIAGIAMALVAVALVADIAGRELLGGGIFGAQRTAVYGMIVSAFLGLVLASQAGRHIRIEGLDRLLPVAWEPVIVRTGHLVSVGICLFLAYWCADFVAVAFQEGERGMALDIPVWPIKLILPYAFASAAFRYLLFFYDPSLEEKPQEVG